MQRRCQNLRPRRARSGGQQDMGWRIMASAGARAYNGGLRAEPQGGPGAKLMKAF